MATSSKPKSPTCQYLQRRGGEAKLDECGDPAVYRLVHRTHAGQRMHYCKEHGDFIRRQFELETLDGKSMGKPIKWANKLSR